MGDGGGVGMGGAGRKVQNIHLLIMGPSEDIVIQGTPVTIHVVVTVIAIAVALRATYIEIIGPERLPAWTVRAFCNRGDPSLTFNAQSTSEGHSRMICKSL